jgi:hypothetical protein
MLPTRTAAARDWLQLAAELEVEVRVYRDIWWISLRRYGPIPPIFRKAGKMLKADIIAILTNAEAEHNQS